VRGGERELNRRLEARDEVRGGRFVAKVSGEQSSARLLAVDLAELDMSNLDELHRSTVWRSKAGYAEKTSEKVNRTSLILQRTVASAVSRVRPP
jgi:hypothetical protein